MGGASARRRRSKVSRQNRGPMRSGAKRTIVTCVAACLPALACGSGTSTKTDGGVDGRFNDTSAGDLDAAPRDARPDHELDAAPDKATERAEHPDAAPTLADLEGAWYTEPVAVDGGPAIRRRRRFASGTYYEVWESGVGYCGELGAIATADGGVGLELTPQRTAGQGHCDMGAAHVETVAWADSGITFVRDGVASLYLTARTVPKIFATLEVHDGDFASDATLEGTGPMNKADWLCDHSAAKPDSQTYKAMLADGTTRSASPAIDWVLRPETTYFQANGVLNVFHTNAAALSNPVANNPTQGVADDLSDLFQYQWTGMALDFTSTVQGGSCAGWTSHAEADVGHVAQSAVAQFAFSSSVGVPCDNPCGLLCVSQ
jgi:hypothetical protein